MAAPGRVLLHTAAKPTFPAPIGTHALDVVAGVMYYNVTGLFDGWKTLSGVAPGETQSILIQHLIPSATNGTNTFLDVEESQPVFVVKARVLVNFDRFPSAGLAIGGKLYSNAMVEAGAGQGEIRLFNESDAVVLATIAVTATSFTVQQATLTGLPISGVKNITLEVRHTNSLKLTITTCDFDIIQTPV